MHDVFRGFYSLPDLLPGESPSSWICRAAASQMMSCAEFCGYLGVSYLPDIDKAMLDWIWRVSPYLDEQRWGGMLLAGRALEAMIAVAPWCEQPLLLSDRGAALYGFCPACFAEQRIHYLRIEWRFRLWQACPRHQCPIQRRCHACSGSLETPFDFFRGDNRVAETPSFGYCPRCIRQLSTAPRFVMTPRRMAMLTGQSDGKRQVDDEVAAALYYGVAADEPSEVGSRAHRILGVANSGRLLMEGRHSRAASSTMAAANQRLAAM